MPHPPPYDFLVHGCASASSKRAKAFVRLELRFAQGCLAVAALNSDEHLPSMTGSSDDGCNSATLRPAASASSSFPAIEKDSRQVELRRNRQRVEFHRLPRLTLGLINSPQINDDSRQQIVRSGIGRRKFFRTLQFAQSFGELPLRQENGPSREPHVPRPDQAQSRRLSPHRFALLDTRSVAAPVRSPIDCPRFGTLCISQSIIGVELDCLDRSN